MTNIRPGCGFNPYLTVWCPLWKDRERGGVYLRQNLLREISAEILGSIVDQQPATGKKAIRHRGQILPGIQEKHHLFHLELTARAYMWKQSVPGTNIKLVDIDGNIRDRSLLQFSKGSLPPVHQLSIENRQDEVAFGWSNDPTLNRGSSDVQNLSQPIPFLVIIFNRCRPKFCDVHDLSTPLFNGTGA